jgi:hypothetical protein
VPEDRPGRGDLRPRMRERRAIGHVGGEDPAVGKRPARRRGELRRGQVRRRPAARENIGDDHVERARRELLEYGASVADANPDTAACARPGERQPAPHQVEQLGVQLDRELR